MMRLGARENLFLKIKNVVSWGLRAHVGASNNDGCMNGIVFPLEEMFQPSTPSQNSGKYSTLVIQYDARLIKILHACKEADPKAQL